MRVLRRFDLLAAEVRLHMIARRHSPELLTGATRVGNIYYHSKCSDIALRALGLADCPQLRVYRGIRHAVVRT
jgi:hypothetical protein